MKKIKISELFDLSNFSYRDFLESYEYPWEIIENLNNHLKDNVLIGENSHIDNSVKIEGGAMIGKNCVIRDGVLIRKGCIIGDNVKIGHAVEIKNSIILNDSSAGHFNFIGDSIIGSNVNLGGGAITANSRLDKKNIFVNKVNTNLSKFGAAVGDGCKIGANAVLNPGTILGKNSVVFPLVSVVGVHEANSLLK